MGEPENANAGKCRIVVAAGGADIGTKGVGILNPEAEADGERVRARAPAPQPAKLPEFVAVFACILVVGDEFPVPGGEVGDPLLPPPTIPPTCSPANLVKSTIPPEGGYVVPCPLSIWSGRALPRVAVPTPAIFAEGVELLLLSSSSPWDV